MYTLDLIRNKEMVGESILIDYQGRVTGGVNAQQEVNARGSLNSQQSLEDSGYGVNSETQQLLQRSVESRAESFSYCPIVFRSAHISDAEKVLGLFTVLFGITSIVAGVVYAVFGIDQAFHSLSQASLSFAGLGLTVLIFLCASRRVACRNMAHRYQHNSSPAPAFLRRQV